MVDAAHAPSETTRLRRFAHPVRLVGVCILLAVALAGSFAVGRFLVPPPESSIAAANRPIPVTATVEKRAVDARASFAGTMKAGETRDVTVSPTSSPAVVTRQPLTAGSTFAPGDLIAAISGEPYIALPGPLPLYRDLTLGDSGDDVTALQHSLTAVGLSTAATGKVDAGTLAAVQQLYADAGFPAAKGAPLDTITAHQLVPLPAGTATIQKVVSVGTIIDDSTPLLTLRTSANYVAFRADAVDAAHLKVGGTMTVQRSGQSFPVKVTHIGPFTAGGNGTLPGRDISVSSSDTQFLKIPAGTPTTVLGSGQAEPSLAVPLTAVRQDNAGDYVWRAVTVKGERSFARVTVVVDSNGGGWAAIHDGNLHVGDEVRVS